MCYGKSEINSKTPRGILKKKKKKLNFLKCFDKTANNTGRAINRITYTAVRVFAVRSESELVAFSSVFFSVIFVL